MLLRLPCWLCLRWLCCADCVCVSPPPGTGLPSRRESKEKSSWRNSSKRPRAGWETPSWRSSRSRQTACHPPRDLCGAPVLPAPVLCVCTLAYMLCVCTLAYRVETPACPSVTTRQLEHGRGRWKEPGISLEKCIVLGQMNGSAFSRHPPTTPCAPSAAGCTVHANAPVQAIVWLSTHSLCSPV